MTWEYGIPYDDAWAEFTQYKLCGVSCRFCKVKDKPLYANILWSKYFIKNNIVNKSISQWI